MLGIGGTELVLILFFGFLIFGPEKMPEMGRTVGRMIRQFKEASDKANTKFKEEVYDPFQEAVQPYKEEFSKDNTGLKEDLAAIQGTLEETTAFIKDPIDSIKVGLNETAQQIKDPLGLKKDIEETKNQLTNAATPTLESDNPVQSDDSSSSNVRVEPVPQSDGKQNTVAESLYGLNETKEGE